MQGSENLDVCVLGEDDPAFVDHSSSVCAAVLWDKGNKQGFGAEKRSYKPLFLVPIPLAPNSQVLRYHEHTSVACNCPVLQSRDG